MRDLNYALGPMDEHSVRFPLVPLPKKCVTKSLAPKKSGEPDKVPLVPLPKKCVTYKPDMPRHDGPCFH